MIDEISVKKMLDHWIEHNLSHSKSFRERAMQIQSAYPESSKAVLEAADLMDQCTEKLKVARNNI